MNHFLIVLLIGPRGAPVDSTAGFTESEMLSGLGILLLVFLFIAFRVYLSLKKEGYYDSDDKKRKKIFEKLD